MVTVSDSKPCPCPQQTPMNNFTPSEIYANGGGLLTLPENIPLLFTYLQWKMLKD